MLVGVIAKKFYLKKKKEKQERDLQESLERSRRSRRAETRQSDISEKDMCVVCVSNPKEVNNDYYVYSYCYQLNICLGHLFTLRTRVFM